MRTSILSFGIISWLGYAEDNPHDTMFISVWLNFLMFSRKGSTNFKTSEHLTSTSILVLLNRHRLGFIRIFLCLDFGSMKGRWLGPDLLPMKGRFWTAWLHVAGVKSDEHVAQNPQAQLRHHFKTSKAFRVRVSLSQIRCTVHKLLNFEEITVLKLVEEPH